MKANEAWLNTINDVLKQGTAVASQRSTGAGGRVSFELLAHTMHFQIAHPIVTLKPNTSWLYMCAEPLWVLSGSSQLNWCPEIEKIQGPYSDNQVTLAGAYGPPFKAQMEYVIDKLNSDRNTRQAVMTIWRRNPMESKDIPCTVAIQFIIRDEVLNCIVTMRSSDVGMGLPYDMLTFACMTAEIASKLEDSTGLGLCYITAGSRHIYQDQFDKLLFIYKHASELIDKVDDKYNAWQVWTWPAIKEKMEIIAFSPYEDRSLYQSIAKQRLLGAS